MHIVAMGGGGFLMEPENPRLDDYILSLARRPTPRVCAIPTASGDDHWNALRFYDAFAKKDCKPTHLALFRRTVRDIRAFLLEQDVIYVGGGNTVSLLAVWRAHGVDTALREAHAAGVVLAGVSAGSLCWFEGGITDSFGPELAPIHDGLGLLPGSNCPHYDGEAQRRPTYHRAIAAGLAPGYAADDGCALHFEGTSLKRIVSSRPNAKAYRVGLVGDAIEESPLPTDYLGQ